MLIENNTEAFIMHIYNDCSLHTTTIISELSNGSVTITIMAEAILLMLQWTSRYLGVLFNGQLTD